MPCLHLIPSLFQYRPFCVQDNKLFCKSSQYKRHRPNDFTETSGHEMKIIPCHVMFMRFRSNPKDQIIKLSQQAQQGYAKHTEIPWNLLPQRYNKKGRYQLVCATPSATSSMLEHFFFCLMHVLETCLTMNTQKADLRA